MAKLKSEELKKSLSEEPQKVPKKRAKSRDLLTAVILMVLMTLGWGILNSWPVRDFWQSLGYEPSAKVAEVHDALELTDEGRRIFRSARPVLEGSEAFNAHCDSHNLEVALLGCYTGGQIYVYEVTNQELVDANKVTMAHELLHATWLRMNERERQKVTELMGQVDAANTAEWEQEELEAYADKDPEVLIEEKYTRIGTKIRDLPEELERHYARYFQNRAKIVGFYENYQAPFTKLKSETEKLGAEIVEERAAIATDRSAYETKLENLNQAIQKFNRCANTAGCFTSDAVFQSQKNTLNAEQTNLDAERLSLNSRIDQTNAKLVEYQQNLRTLGELNDAMNSNAIESL